MLLRNTGEFHWNSWFHIKLINFPFVVTKLELNNWFCHIFSFVREHYIQLHKQTWIYKLRWEIWAPHKRISWWPKWDNRSLLRMLKNLWQWVSISNLLSRNKITMCNCLNAFEAKRTWKWKSKVSFQFVKIFKQFKQLPISTNINHVILNNPKHKHMLRILIHWIVHLFSQKITEKCFKKCVPKPGTSLGGSEQKCIAMCMDRFMDSWNLVSRTYVRRLQRESGGGGF